MATSTLSNSLQEKINILIENSALDPQVNYQQIKTGFQIEPTALQNYVLNIPEYFSYSNNHVLTLKALYIQEPKGVRENIEKMMLKKIKENIGAREAATVFNFLSHTGHLEEALNTIYGNFHEGMSEEYYSEIVELSNLLTYEWKTISYQVLMKLRSWINQTITYQNALGNDIQYSSRSGNLKILLSKVYKQTSCILTKTITKEVFAVYNPEINEDEKKLVDEFSRYGFPLDLTDTLNKIDSMFGAASDDFDFKGCMDLIRSFTERLYASISIALDSTKGKTIDEKDSEKVAKFFVEKGLISQDQGKVLISLRHFLSNVGSHRLKSREEDARLSKNMTIELALYLLKRVKSIQTE